MTFRSSDSQTPSVSCDIVGSRRRFVCLCVTVCVYVRMCVRPYMREGGPMGKKKRSEQRKGAV